MYLEIFLLALLVAFTVNWWRSRGFPPGPWGLPIVGYLPWINPTAPHVTLSNLAKQYGRIYGLHLGSVYTVVLSDSNLVRKAFAKDTASGRAPLYLTHGIMKGYGLICAEGELWKDQRKFAANFLRQFGVSKYGPKRKQVETIIMQEVNDFVEFVEKNHNSEMGIVFNPLESLRHSVGTVMCRIVFGTGWKKDDKTWLWLQHLQEEGTKHIGVAGPLNFLPFLRFLPNFKRTMNFLLNGKHDTHRVYELLIEDQRKILHEEQQKGKEVGSIAEAKNIIQAFLLEGEKRSADDVEKFYNNQQFYHLLADIFGAGLDTTLATLRWYLAYMANHVNIQTQVQEELDNLLQGRLPTLDELYALPVLESSLAETQRIRSVTPVGIPHGALCEMEIDGYTVPKGAMIVPLQWAIHMDAAQWDDPAVFKPSRFLNEEGKFAKTDAFIPYQTGKRMCIGDELARMLLFLFSATIMQKFKILPKNEVPLDLEGESGIMLTPKAYELVFVPRKKID